MRALVAHEDQVVTATLKQWLRERDVDIPSSFDAVSLGPDLYFVGPDIARVIALATQARASHWTSIVVAIGVRALDARDVRELVRHAVLPYDQTDESDLAECLASAGGCYELDPLRLASETMRATFDHWTWSSVLLSRMVLALRVTKGNKNRAATEIGTTREHLNTAVQSFRRIDSVSCDAYVLFGPTKGGLLRDSPQVDKLATGPLSSVFVAPTFTPLTPPIGAGDVPGSVEMSDTTLAFSLQMSGRVLRVPVGQASYVSTSAIKVNEPVVVGDDVYAFNIYGTDGWSRVVRVNADGTTTPFRSAAQRHVSGFRAGAGWAAWLETFGDSNPQNLAQPNAELWAAPYTNDPTTLNTNAKKIADVPGVGIAYLGPQYADGYYAVRGSLTGMDFPIVYVVRVSDGVLKKIDVDALVGPDASKPFYFSSLAGVSEREVIGILHHRNGIPSFGVARIQLGPWP